MRFELSFNETIYREQSKKYFDFVWKDFQLKNKKKLYVIVPYFLIGAFIVYAKSNLGYLFLLFSFFNLYQYYKVNQYYKTNKEKYFSKVEKMILEQSSRNKISIWEFNEDKFYYSDYNLEINMNWNLLSNFIILENDLFLEAKERVLATFQLNKEEVGES